LDGWQERYLACKKPVPFVPEVLFQNKRRRKPRGMANQVIWKTDMKTGR